MDRERCDAWAAAFAKLKTGLQVWDLPPEEHYALLRPGLFEGMDEVTAQEEAEWVVRYWLHGRDSFIHRSAWSSNCEELAQNRTDIRRGSGRRGDQERSLMSAELFSQAPVFSHDAWAIHSTLISWLFGALLHGPEQIADLPVPVAESPGAVRIGHPERSHLVEYLAPNSVFNSLPRQRSSPHLRPDDRLVTIDRVLHHASLGVA